MIIYLILQYPDGLDNFYDKIIEKENLNLKNNFITNTLSEKNIKLNSLC